jgi:hypothetical protein
MPKVSGDEHPEERTTMNDYDRATNAHFSPDKLRGATSKPLIVLSPSLSLN